MLVKEVVDILKAREIYIDDQNIYNKNYDLHINLFQTDETMFEACGKLYKAGMRR